MYAFQKWISVRMNAEIKEDVVVEDDIFLNRVVIASVCDQTNDKTDCCDVASLVAKGSARRALDWTDHQVADNETEH